MGEKIHESRYLLLRPYGWRISLFGFALLMALNSHDSGATSCCFIQAFSPIPAVARRTAVGHSRGSTTGTTRRFASSSDDEKNKEEKQQGAPQYDKIMAKLQKAEPVAKGAVLLQIEAQDDDASWEYEPGHVLALEIKGNPKDKTTHTYEDTKKNNGWMRGPYTVTASPSNRELQVLLKIVGEKSQAFADAEPGTPIQVGGKFKVPIVEGIDVDSTDQVILLSTGVGIGPCVGAMEKVMDAIKADGNFPPIHLVASFRTEEEIVFADKLNQMQSDYPNQFSWTPVVTSGPEGRVSSSVERLQESLQATITSSTTTTLDLSKTHFHLIGNGGLVYEFQKGLEAAGVPKEKVTLELYFGHQSKPNEQVVETIFKAVQGLAVVDATTTAVGSS